MAIPEPGTDAQPVVDVYQRYDDRLSGKLTWKINDKMTLNQTGLYEWWQYLSTFPTVTTPATALAWYPGDIRLSGTEWNWVLNNTTVLGLTTATTLNRHLSSAWART